MRIPENIVEQIRRDTDIVEVVSDFVNLKQRGRNFLGLCPFHNEKTPSFNVLPDKGIFKCFGCGKGGDAITFIREHQKMSYPDAIRFLAERLGITIEDDISGQQAGENNRFENAYNALRLAGNFFYKNLYTEIGSEALEYVRLRGFSEETVKKFGLGFSPDSFSATMQELQALGISEEALFDAGLVGKKEETGKIYDRFRGRLMFPIQNTMGRVIGFGGRRMNDEDKASAKYLNSPQSLVYNKSEVLYGIFHAKETLRKREYAILVEGYADLLSVSQAGFQNVVASSGTALTREQLRLLSRFCKKIKIVYDADNAGINAAMRGLDLAVEEDFDVEIVRLPIGEDPDSIIQNDGAEAFQARLDAALSLVDFKGEVFREQGYFATPSGSTKAIHSIMETIAKVPLQIKRDFMIRAVAHRFSLREADLYEELTKILRRNQVSKLKESSKEVSKETSIEAANKGKSSNVGNENLEKSAPSQNVYSLQNLTNVEENVLKNVSDNAQKAASVFRNADQISDKSAENIAAQFPAQKSIDALLPEEFELLRLALTADGACAYMRTKAGVSKELFLTTTAQTLFQIIDEASNLGKPLDYLLKQAAQGVEIPNEIHGLAIRSESPSERWSDFGAEITEDSVRVVYDCITRLRILALDKKIAQIMTELHNAENLSAESLSENGENGAQTEAESGKRDLLEKFLQLDSERRKMTELLIRH